MGRIAAFAAVTATASLLIAGCSSAPPAEMPQSDASPASAESTPYPQDEFFAELDQSGVEFPDLDAADFAAMHLCAMLDEGAGLIVATADTMRNFEFTSEQADAVSVAAVKVYCPESV